MNDQPKFHVSEKLLAYAKKLEAEQLDEPQPDLYIYDGPGGFYPGEKAADYGDGE